MLRMVPFKTIGIVGLGVMGGALALQIRKKFPDSHLLGFDQDEAVMKQAVSERIMDVSCRSVEDIARDTDLVLVCVSISHTADVVKRVCAAADRNVVVSDIASVKTAVCRAVGSVGSRHLFVPAHPMAGSEKSGLAHASTVVLDKAPYIIIPQDHPKYPLFKGFLIQLGVNPIEMALSDHDTAMAYVSHFPFLVAGIPVKVLQKLSPGLRALIEKVKGPGFRDTTRVSASSVTWALDILKYNRAHILDVVKDGKRILSELEALIETGDDDQLRAYFSGLS